MRDHLIAASILAADFARLGEEVEAVLAAGFHELRVRRDPDCALCGSRATITDLSGHAA